MIYASEERVETLETLFGEFIVQHNRSLNRMERVVSQLGHEVTELKNEMKEFKDEMKEFKDEMKEFKDETRKEHQKMNKQWGHLANKMGTIVEDLIAPAIGPAIKRYFDRKVDVMQRIHFNARPERQEAEFDVIAACEDMVFFVEVKSSPEIGDIKAIKKKCNIFTKYLPHYANHTIVPMFGSVQFKDSIIKKATENGIYTLAYREWDYMDILNFEEIKERKASTN